VANTVLYSHFSLVTVGSAWTAQIDRESTGLKTAQAGGRFPGPGPRCGLGRGGARAGLSGQFWLLGRAKAVKKRGHAAQLGHAAGPLRALASGPLRASWPRRPRVGMGRIGRTTQSAHFFVFSFSRSYN